MLKVLYVAKKSARNSFPEQKRGGGVLSRDFGGGNDFGGGTGVVVVGEDEYVFWFPFLGVHEKGGEPP